MVFVFPNRVDSRRCIPDRAFMTGRRLILPPSRLNLRTAAKAVVFGAILGGLASCSREAARPAALDGLAPPVEAVQARAGSLPLTERLSGTVVAENQVVLLPEVAGRVTTVLVENGATVEQGQPLVELRNDSLREQARQAEAGHRISEARLRQAEAAFAELEAEVRRTQELGRRSLVTELELETAAAQLDSARADVDLARAQLEQSAATLAEQRELLAKTTVRAPITGVVGQRNAEIGMQVTPSTPLFTIGNLDRMKVRVNLTDRMLHYIEVGQPARILAAGPDDAATALDARVTRISPFLNEITRSTEAEILVPNPGQRLLPGMFVAVDIAYGESTRATLVPTSALYHDPNSGRTGFFIVSGPMPDRIDTTRTAPPQRTSADEQPGTTTGVPLSLAEPRPVEFRSARIVARGAMEVAVESIQPGDWVVTLGQDMLSTERQQARIHAVSWDHVLELQNVKREDLLEDLLRGSSASAGGNGAN